MAEEASLHPVGTCAEEEAKLTSALQPDHRLQASPSPSAASTNQHPYHPPTNFTFPTLRLDGSLPDLSLGPPSINSQYQPTPPAALSSLGARSKMADHEQVPETSLDAPYDMIDDISEISNDDHETASLLSTEREESGQMTPEESVVDLREVEVGEDSTHMTTENAVMDSYMSEELETPRQSIMHSKHTLLSSSPASPPQTTIDSARRVLFVSHRTVSNAEISDICLRIASCLLPEDQAVSESISRLVKLPNIPDGGKPVSAIHLRIADIELLVEPRLASEPISFLRDDPDLVIYYLNQLNSYPDQFDVIKSALKTGSIPSVTIGAAGFEYGKLSNNDENRAYNTDVVLTDEELFHEDDKILRGDLQKLLLKPTPQPSTLSSSVCLEYLWDRMCAHEACKNIDWQEVLFRLAPFLLALVAVLIGCAGVSSQLQPPLSPRAEVDARREALIPRIFELDYPVDFWRGFNVVYLLPYPQESESSSPTDVFPNPVPCQGIAPNHIIVSLPKPRNARKFPQPVWTNVKRSDTRLEFNKTELIDGLWDFTIPSDEAYGTVRVSLFVKDPEIEIYAEHNFGSKRSQTYEKVGMELSKTINKDISVARKNVQSLKDKVAIELSAGATATKNVTSELAIYIARDLQVLANTAVSVFVKAAAASNTTAANIRKELVTMQKDLALLQKDLIKLTGDMHKSVSKKAQAALITTTRPIKNGLKLSRDRARELRDKLALRMEKKETNSSAASATKELSLRFRNFFDPSEKGKKAGSLMDIAKCAAGKEDYRSCRRAQKAEKAVASLAKAAVTANTPTSNGWGMKSKEKNLKAAAGCQSKKLKLGKKKTSLPESKAGKKGAGKEKEKKGRVHVR